MATAGRWARWVATAVLMMGGFGPVALACASTCAERPSADVLACGTQQTAVPQEEGGQAVHVEGDGTSDPKALTTRGVRPVDPEAVALIGEAQGVSETIREQVTSLSRSDVIVHLSVRALHGVETSGMRFASATSAVRFLRIEIDARKSRDAAIATLGHELQHALEVAAASNVRNAASLDQLYRRIGRQATARSFETQAAIDVGGAVGAEVRTARRQSPLR